MPRFTIKKLFLITCVAGFAAAAVSIGHAEKASIMVPATAAPQTTPQMCPAARSPLTRAPKYKRYLNQTPVSRIVRRNG